MIKPERELSGIAALFSAVFLAGALVAGKHAAGVHCWSATGAFGPVGSCARSAILDLVGPVAAAIVPLSLVLYAAYRFGAIEGITHRAWQRFAAGSTVLMAIGAAIARGAIPGASGPHPRPDLAGGIPAWLLVHTIGVTGAWVCVALASSALLIATLAHGRIRRLLAAARQIATNPDDSVPGVAPRRYASKPEWNRGAAGHTAAEVPTPSFAVVSQPVTRQPVRLKLPPRDLLSASAASRGQDTGQLDVIGYRLTGALRALKFDGVLVGRLTGPAVTQFEVAPAPGLKLREIAGAGSELAAAMKVGAARVVAPIPGKGTIGIEVPNPLRESVDFRGMAENPEFESAAMALPLLMGRDLSGKALVADLAKMPHLLVAGGEGSGKSMCLNAFIGSLVCRHTPETLRFLMVEHGQDDLSAWDMLPHLRHPVVRSTPDAIAVVEWAALEMEQRCRTIVAAGARNIRDYNAHTSHDALPYIVLVINEIADIILSDEGVEGPLAVLAQRGRIAGIHVILATARPNANVVTPLLKANFPSRIALRMSSPLDSRRVLDGIGAEALVGEGDMLFIAPGKSEPVRLQGTTIVSGDCDRLAAWYGGSESASGRIASAAEGKEADVIEEMRAKEALPVSP